MNDQPIDPAELAAKLREEAKEYDEPADRVFHTTGELLRNAADMIESLVVQQERAAVQAGWQVVPVEPTQQMIGAGSHHAWYGECEKAYCAMLAAAPKGPMDDAEKLYTDRLPWELEPWYSKHIRAMTAEGLHEKSNIACELAARDKQNDYLRAALADAETDRQMWRRHSATVEDALESAEQAKQIAERDAAKNALIRVRYEDGWYMLTSDIVPGLCITNRSLSLCIADIDQSIYKLCALNNFDLHAAIDSAISAQLSDEKD